MTTPTNFTPPDGGSYLVDPDTGTATQLEPTTAPAIRKSERIAAEAAAAAAADTTPPARRAARNRTE